MPSRWHVPKASLSWHEQITIGTGGNSRSKSGEAGAVWFRHSESREAYQAPEPKTKPLAAMAIALVDVRVLDFGTARAPCVDEKLAGEAEKGRGAQRGP